MTLWQKVVLLHLPVFVNSLKHPQCNKLLSSACIVFTKHVRDTGDNFKAVFYFNEEKKKHVRRRQNFVAESSWMLCLPRRNDTVIERSIQFQFRIRCSKVIGLAKLFPENCEKKIKKTLVNLCEKFG